MVPRNGDKRQGKRRKNSKETRAHFEAMVLRTKPEANKWLNWDSSIGRGCFRARRSDDQEDHTYSVNEVNLAKNAEEKSAEFVTRVCQVTLEAFWT